MQYDVRSFEMNMHDNFGAIEICNMNYNAYFNHLDYFLWFPMFMII